MTTQDAATQAADKAGGSAIEPEEAERLASMIRPAWELDLDDAQLAAIGGGPRKADPQSEAAAAKLAEGGVDIGTPSSNPLAPQRDTVIDGVPMVRVGETDPGRATDPGRPSGTAPAKATNVGFLAAVAEGVAIVDRGAAAAAQPAPTGAHLEAPRRAGPTKLGLGEDVAAIVAAASAPPASPSVMRTESEVTSAMPVSGEMRRAGAELSEPQGSFDPAAEAPRKENLRGTVRMDAPSQPPGVGAGSGGDAEAEFDARATAMHPKSHPPPEMHQASVAPMGASYSRADDPIEIPVKKGPLAVLIFIGLTVIAAGIVAGVMFLGADDKPKSKTSTTMADDTKAAETSRTTATSTAAASTASSAAASTASTMPTETATASADASSSTPVASSAPPEPTAPATVATAAPPPKTPPPKIPPPKTPPPKTPPPKGTGIIRTTPF